MNTQGVEGSRYGAFLSYSHADTRIARWLHRKLESYRTPRGLRGQPGRFGPVPERIGRVYRDRDESAAGGRLRDEIESALADSAALVVLCSPAAAHSAAVDQEATRFQALGRGGRIIPVIVDGEPPACWPPSLADGRDLLSADLRKGKDGRDHGLLKILAGLLGVGMDELVQRERAARRRRAGYMVGLVAVLAGLAITACGAAYVALDRSARLQDGFVGLLDQIMVEVDDVFAHSVFGDGDGTLTTGEVLRALGRAERQVGIAFRLAPDNDRLLAAEARMRTAFARHQVMAGEFKKARGNADRAETIVNDLVARKVAVDDLVVLQAWLTAGDVAGTERRLEDSLDLAEKGLAYARAAGNRPMTAEFLMSVAVTYLAQDRVDEAVPAFRDASVVFGAWAVDEAENTAPRRGMKRAMDGIATANASRGKLPEALAAYEESLVLARQLAARTPGSRRLLADMANSLNMIGLIRLEMGETDAARKALEEGLGIARDLNARDTGHEHYRYLVASFLMQVGDVRRAQDEPASARAAYEEGIALNRQLAERAPADGRYPNMGARLLSGLVEVLGSLGQPEAARAALGEEGAWIEAMFAKGTLSSAAAAEWFGGLAGGALSARDFARAEAAARRGLELDPEQKWIATHIAHALMLQDRLAEADAIYDAHRGVQLPQSGESWEQTVADEFDSLRSSGITHPHMDAVLARFGK